MDKDSHLEFSRISKLLRKAGLDSDEANELTERIMILASSSVLRQIDSLKTEVRSYKESTDSKIDSQKSRITVLTDAKRTQNGRNWTQLDAIGRSGRSGPTPALYKSTIFKFPPE